MYQRENASPSLVSLGGSCALISVCGVAIVLPRIIVDTLFLVLCWIEVDLDAVATNVRALQALAAPREGVTAVLKAQAYGMGAVAVAQASIQAGARGVAVARLSEARLLRTAGFDAPVLLLGGVDPGEAAAVVRLGVTPTLTDWATAEHVAAAAFDAGVTHGVQVKVDTGMTRYGAPPDEATAIVRSLPRL